MELQPISLVRLLDRLVDQGLLERRPHPTDRRANQLNLTDTGRRLVDDLDSLRDSIASETLRGVSVASLQTVLNVLLQVKDNVKNNADTAAAAAPPPPKPTPPKPPIKAHPDTPTYTA